MKTKELYTLDTEADETRANGKPHYRYAYLYIILVNKGLWWVISTNMERYWFWKDIPLNAQSTFYLKCNLRYLERNNIESEFVVFAENGIEQSIGSYKEH